MTSLGWANTLLCLARKMRKSDLKFNPPENTSGILNKTRNLYESKAEMMLGAGEVDLCVIAGWKRGKTKSKLVHSVWATCLLGEHHGQEGTKSQIKVK